MCAKIVKRKDFEEEKKAKGEALSPLEKSSALLGKSSSSILGRKTIQAQNEAEQILAHAEAEAKKIREEALQLRAEAEKVYESERKRGYLEGEKRGLALSSEKLVRLEALKEEFYRSVEDEVIRLSMAVAEKVIGQIAVENKEMIKSVVKKAIERSIGDRIVIRVHPDDYKNIVGHDGEFRDIVDRTKRILFKEDEATPQGGCIVETEVGTIDAQLETQLEAIRKALGIS